MEKTPPLYNALNAWLGQSVPWAHQAHLKTCLWMVMALLQRGEVSLTRWLPYIPCRGTQAQSKQRRLSRWLHNSRLNIHRLYKYLIKAALADWQEDCLNPIHIETWSFSIVFYGAITFTWQGL